MSAIQRSCVNGGVLGRELPSEGFKKIATLVLATLALLFLAISAWSTYQTVSLYGARTLFTSGVYTLLLPVAGATLLTCGALYLSKIQSSETAVDYIPVKTSIPGMCLFIAAEGSTVKKGDVVCIVEAMKMEIIIRAEKEGRLSKIGVKTHEMMQADQVVAYIES